jgi:hypothetical protein
MMSRGGICVLPASGRQRGDLDFSAEVLGPELIIPNLLDMKSVRDIEDILEERDDTEGTRA